MGIDFYLVTPEKSCQLSFAIKFLRLRQTLVSSLEMIVQRYQLVFDGESTQLIKQELSRMKTS